MSESDAPEDDSPPTADALAPTAIVEIMGEKLFVIQLKDCRGRGGAVIDAARARTARFVLQHSLARALGIKSTGSSFPSILDRFGLGQTVLTLDSTHSVRQGLISQPNLRLVLDTLFASMRQEDPLSVNRPRKAALVLFTAAVTAAKNMRSRPVLQMLNEPIPQTWVREDERAAERERGEVTLFEGKSEDDLLDELEVRVRLSACV